MWTAAEWVSKVFGTQNRILMSCEWLFIIIAGNFRVQCSALKLVFCWLCNMSSGHFFGLPNCTNSDWHLVASQSTRADLQLGHTRMNERTVAEGERWTTGRVGLKHCCLLLRYLKSFGSLAWTDDDDDDGAELWNANLFIYSNTSSWFNLVHFSQISPHYILSTCSQVR